LKDINSLQTYIKKLESKNQELVQKLNASEAQYLKLTHEFGLLKNTNSYVTSEKKKTEELLEESKT